MLTFIAQYDKHHGPDGAKQYKLVLDIDESHKRGLKGIMDFAKGDTFLVVLIPVDDEFSSVGEAINETEDNTKTRLNRQLHALIREVSNNNALTIDEVRTSLKDMLKKKNYIQKSTKELDVKGLAAAIYILQNEF